MKFFIRKWLSYVVPIVTFIVCVNLISDPANIIHAVEAKIAGYLAKGYNVTNVYNIDERSLQRYVIQSLKVAPLTVLLGSSRIMLVGQTYYGRMTINNSVSGASIEDLIAIYQIYKQNGLELKKVVIGIDPWLFNVNSEQPRWLTLASEYNDFFQIRSSGAVWAMKKYLQFFSLSYFQESIKFLPNRFKNTELKAVNEVVNPGFTRLTDGTIFYDAKYRNVTAEGVEELAKRFVSGNVYSLEKFDEISPDILRKFDRFVSELTENKTTVEFLLMPYHPIVYEYLINTEKYKIIKEVETFVKKYANEKKIYCRGSYDPVEFKLENEDFYDGMHLTPDGLKKILK